MVAQRPSDTIDTSGSLSKILPVLILAAILGLVFIFLVPPWQHYDEPNHFEHAWLIAHYPRLPKSGDMDLQMRQELSQSMIEHQFFRDIQFPVELTLRTPAWIGEYSQLDEPPLYYLTASLPLRLLKSQPIDIQLYAARMVSLVFYLIATLAAFGVAWECFGPASPLFWLLPAGIALLPGFTDLMTAVNNDAAAVGLFSAFLWLGVRLIRRGFHWLEAAGLIILTILCLLTKSTVFIAGFLCILVLVISSVKPSLRWIAWLSAMVVVVIAGVLLISWDDGLFWYRSSAQAQPVRVENLRAPDGSYVFQLDLGAAVTPEWVDALFQPLAHDVSVGLRGKILTLGVWMWADRPMDAVTPFLRDNTNRYSQTVKLETSPTFFVVSGEISDQSSRVWVSIDPGSRSGESGTMVYYDGFVLTEGIFSPGTLPVSDPQSPEEGSWDGRRYINLLRNPSAEIPGPRWLPFIDNFGARFLPDNTRPSLMGMYIIDAVNVSWHYSLSAANLFRTFWGKFGWGNVPLLGHKPYRPLLILAGLGILGSIIGLIQWKRVFIWDVLVFLVLALGVIWGPVLLRGIIYLDISQLYLPAARYAYPAIIPAMMIMISGWFVLLFLAIKALHGSSRAVPFIIFIGLSAFTIYAWISLWVYYYS